MANLHEASYRLEEADIPTLNRFLRSILTGPLAAVTKETGPSTWAPLANHTQALLQDLVLRNALRANASIAYRLQPLADEFLATGTLPPPDLLQVRRLLFIRKRGNGC